MPDPSPETPAEASDVSRWGEVTIRPYRPGDEHRILAAFNRIFAAQDPDFRPRTLAEWRWAFSEGPSGFEAHVAEAEDGTIVGQYAALVQPMLLAGGPARFLHPVDSMTDPAVRGGLAKSGLFARIGTTFFDFHGGRAPERVPVIWGLPVPAAWRIGKALIGYKHMRTQLKLGLAPGDLRLPRAAPDPVRVEEVERFPEDVGELFRRAARPGGAIVVRDVERLEWRFTRHPRRRYRIALARRGTSLCGYAVWRVGDFDGERDEGLAVDWLVPADDDGAARALAGWLSERARAEGVERVTIVLPDTDRDWLRLQRMGFTARPTRYVIVVCDYDRFDERWLYRRFYYTLADTDLA